MLCGQKKMFLFRGEEKLNFAEDIKTLIAVKFTCRIDFYTVFLEV